MFALALAVFVDGSQLSDDSFFLLYLLPASFVGCLIGGLLGGAAGLVLGGARRWPWARWVGAGLAIAPLGVFFWPTFTSGEFGQSESVPGVVSFYTSALAAVMIGWAAGRFFENRLSDWG